MLFYLLFLLGLVNMQETIEFANVISLQNFVSPEITSANVLRQLKSATNETWAKKCHYSFKADPTAWFARNDTFMDTSDDKLNALQAKLRFREYDVKKPDLTLKFSSQIKKIAEEFNTKANSKYESETKLEQNVYGWYVYSRNFYHRSTKIQDLTKIWPLTEWTASYINKFYPDFSKTFKLKSSDLLHVFSKNYVYVLDDIVIGFGDDTTTLSIEFAFDAMTMESSTINKIEISWKIEKDNHWDLDLIDCHMSLLKYLQQQ